LDSGVCGYPRQPQALLAAPGADHVQGRFAAGPIKRAAQHLPVNGHNSLALGGKLLHEPLKRGAKLIRIKIAKQPAEGIVTGQTLLQLEEAAQKRLLRLGEQRYIRRSLASAQHRAQSNDQKLIEVMQNGIAGARVFQALPTRGKLMQRFFTGHVNPPAKIAVPTSFRKCQRWFNRIPNAIPLGPYWLTLDKG